MASLAIFILPVERVTPENRPRAPRAPRAPRVSAYLTRNAVLEQRVRARALAEQILVVETNIYWLHYAGNNRYEHARTRR